MVLSSINTQLPQLRHLTLTSKHSWAGERAVWEQLGESTQLTRLAISFDKTVGVGAQVKDLTPLSSLTGLQSLGFQLFNRGALLQLDGVDPGDAGFLAHLTALTELQGDFVLKPGMLQHISSCTALQSLWLRAGFFVRPSSSDWQGLGELTHLTMLHVTGSILRDQGPQPFYSSLQHLRSLQEVRVSPNNGHWTWAAVPALAALTKLTSVSGDWAVGDEGLESNGVCEQVVWLCEASGSVPFKAFPNVKRVVLAGSLDTGSWESLGSCCPKVRKIERVCSARNDAVWPSVPAAATGAERVAALRGLSQLTGLTQLAFNISHKLEAAALANAMQQVTGLRQLMLGLCSSPELDWGCLHPLGKLTTVTTAIIASRVPLASKQDCQVLLSVLAHICYVLLTVSAADVATVREAVQESRAIGLELPRRVQAKAFPM